VKRDLAGVFIAFCDLLMCFLVVVVTMVAVRRPDAANGPELKAEYLITAEWSVDVDADVDLWVVGPGGKPVFYSSREVGCLHLDRDSRGFLDNWVTLADGRVVKSASAKETVTMRCVAPGHYDVAVHLYSYRIDNIAVSATRKDLALSVRVQIVKLNPALTMPFTADARLDRRWQTANIVSFDLDAEGGIALSDPPLAPLTDEFYRSRATQ